MENNEDLSKLTKEQLIARCSMRIRRRFILFKDYVETLKAEKAKNEELNKNTDSSKSL